MIVVLIIRSISQDLRTQMNSLKKCVTKKTEKYLVNSLGDQPVTPYCTRLSKEDTYFNLTSHTG